jgi:hypothetical protein
MYLYIFIVLLISLNNESLKNKIAKEKQKSIQKKRFGDKKINRVYSTGIKTVAKSYKLLRRRRPALLILELSEQKYDFKIFFFLNIDLYYNLQRLLLNHTNSTRFTSIIKYFIDIL